MISGKIDNISIYPTDIKSDISNVFEQLFVIRVDNSDDGQITWEIQITKLTQNETDLTFSKKCEFITENLSTNQKQIMALAFYKWNSTVPKQTLWFLFFLKRILSHHNPDTKTWESHYKKRKLQTNTPLE